MRRYLDWLSEEKRLRWILLALLGLIMLSWTHRRHDPLPYFYYRSEIWADKGGYYFYLPAFFIHGFEPANWPEKMDEKTGNGFKLDYEQNKLVSKYPTGLAILWTPFFLTAHLLAEPMGQNPDGYAPIYHKVLNYAAIFYFLASLIFLFAYLRQRYSFRVTVLSLVLLTFCTNVCFYVMDESGMSHIYSFCFFSILLYSTDQLFKGNRSLKNYFLFALACTFIFAIRQMNILIIPFSFLMGLGSWKELPQRIMLFLKPLPILLVLGLLILVELPQLFYYKYLSGSYFIYSYSGESFTHLWNPRLVKFWFSPNNGLFIYSPLWIFILAGAIWQGLKGRKQGWFLILLFFGISYLYAAWWSWNLGCGYGARGTVEYLSYFVVPLAAVVNAAFRLSLWPKALLVLVAFVLLWTNLKVIRNYDECFFAEGDDWNWPQYKAYFHDYFVPSLKPR